MTKDLNHVLFGGPKWHGNWTSEPDIQHISKSSSNWHVNQDWCKTNGNFLKKWPKTRIYTYLGTQSDPKIGLLMPIYSTHLNKFASMWSNILGNQWKLFEKITKDQNFHVFWDPKWPQSGPLKPIFHKPLKVLAMCMWSNIDVKPVKTFWECDQSPKFWVTLGPKWPKKLPFEAYIVHISISSSNEHIKQDWCKSRGNFLTNSWKPWILTHLED